MLIQCKLNMNLHFLLYTYKYISHLINILYIYIYIYIYTYIWYMYTHTYIYIYRYIYIHIYIYILHVNILNVYITTFICILIIFSNYYSSYFSSATSRFLIVPWTPSAIFTQKIFGENARRKSLNTVDAVSYLARTNSVSGRSGGKRPRISNRFRIKVNVPGQVNRHIVIKKYTV